MTPKTKEQLDYIMDTFTGADGGVRFVKLLSLVEEMDRQGQENTPNGYAARKVLDETLTKMAKLIELAEGK